LQQEEEEEESLTVLRKLGSYAADAG